MSVTDIFFIVVRWVHLTSAAAWVGGSLFYLVVLRPSLRGSPNESREIKIAAGIEFRALVDTCILVLLATGIVLTFNRLNTNVVEIPYVAVLSVKIALSIWMFVIAKGRLPRIPIINTSQEIHPPVNTIPRRIIRAVSGFNAILVLGISVFLLSDLLKVIYELALESN